MDITFTDVLPYILGSGGVLFFVLSWIRFYKSDAGKVIKLKADAGKVNAEAQEIRAKADILITDGALRIAERLSKDLDEAREEIDKLIIITVELKALHEKAKVAHMEETKRLLDKLKEAKDLLDVKREHCVQIKQRITTLHELLLVKQSGLTHDQFEKFMVKVKAVLDSKYDEKNTNDTNIQ